MSCTYFFVIIIDRSVEVNNLDVLSSNVLSHTYIDILYVKTFRSFIHAHIKSWSYLCLKM